MKYTVIRQNMTRLLSPTEHIPAISRTSKIELAESLAEAKKLPVQALRFPYHRAVFHRYPELYQHHERQYSEPEEGICFHGGSGRNQTAGTRDDCMGGVLVLCVNDDLGTDC